MNRIAAPAGTLVVSGIGHDYRLDDGSVATALESIDLVLSPREILAVVGRSGGGKSTLLNILVGLISPTRGTVTVTVEEGSEVKPISYVPQEDRLFPWRSVQRNVEYPLELRRVDRGTRRARAAHLIERVGLASVADRRPDQLSGGMRQRVSIARALTTRPAVLLLDEPFGALDAWTRHSLHELLIEIQRDDGFSVVLVTHDVSEAIALADRIVTLQPNPGRISGEYRLPESMRPRSQSEIRHDDLYRVYLSIRNDLGLED